MRLDAARTNAPAGTAAEPRRLPEASRTIRIRCHEKHNGLRALSVPRFLQSSTVACRKLPPTGDPVSRGRDSRLRSARSETRSRLMDVPVWQCLENLLEVTD